MQDIHTHLYWESYDSDRKEVIERAQEAGVRTMLVVGTTVEESRKAIMLAKEYPFIYASIGIHPNEFRGNVKYIQTTKIASLIKNLEDLLEENKESVVAIGECGLDYSESHGVITGADKFYQKELFEAQLHLAEKSQLPVIIHCRAVKSESDEAYWDLLEILKKWEAKIPHFILHCYMGSQSITKEFLKTSNIYFSFTGNITYPVKKSIAGGEYDLTEVVRLIPLERIFSETDSPFLAPQEQRGKRNEPAFVVQVVQKIALLHQGSLTIVGQKIEENLQRVFFEGSI